MKNFPSNLPISLCHLCDINNSPVDFLKAAGKAGFSSVSLRLEPIIPDDVAFPLTDPANRKEVARAAADTGVSILSLEFLWMAEGPEPTDLWKRVLDSGAAVGASRLTVGGSSDNLGAVSEKFAAICELAATYDVEVDFEPIPAAPVGGFAQGVEVIRRAGEPANGHLVLDALHFDRGRCDLEDLRDGARYVSVFQLCDAPAKPPSYDSEVLGEEALKHRLLPGDGAISIWPLLDLTPDNCLMAAEVPMDTLFPDLSVTERLTRLHDSVRRFLATDRS